MHKGKKIYEGKAKILYEGPEKGTAIQHFKDDTTAFNNQKKSSVEGKGLLNNRIFTDLSIQYNIHKNDNIYNINQVVIIHITSCIPFIIKNNIITNN